ncbi:MAG: hypothetical protein K2I91_01945 [Muribaculaceae bacterium]|nr:hypothetical protein [Muribaculaceae bacterium]
MFKDSPLSFKDIQVIKNTFKKRLATIYHSRVAYPELKKNEDSAHPDPRDLHQDGMHHDA